MDKVGLSRKCAEEIQRTTHGSAATAVAGI